jgi:hypothetical protein
MKMILKNNALLFVCTEIVENITFKFEKICPNNRTVCVNMQ